MKALLLALVLVSGQAWGAATAQIGWHFGTDALAFLTPDASNYDCVNTGSIGFSTVDGKACAVFNNSGAKFFNCSSTATTAWINANKAAYQIEIHVKKISNTGVDGYWFYSVADPICNGDMTMYDSGGTVGVQNPKTATCNGPGGSAIGTTSFHSLIYSFSGTTENFYFDNVLVQSKTTSANANIDIPLVIGQYTSTYPLDGYVYDVILSNGNVCTGSTCPDYSPTRAPNQISPYIRNSNSPNMFPLFLMRLFDKLFVSPAYALESDQRAEQARNTSNLWSAKVKIDKAKLEADIFSGKVTRTRTPTQVPKSSQSPTPTVTPTVTPTATPTVKGGKDALAESEMVK